MFVGPSGVEPSTVEPFLQPARTATARAISAKTGTARRSQRREPTPLAIGRAGLAAPARHPYERQQYCHESRPRCPRARVGRPARTGREPRNHGVDRIDLAGGLKRHLKRRGSSGRDVHRRRRKCAGGVGRKVGRAHQCDHAAEHVVGHHLKIHGDGPSALHGHGHQLPRRERHFVIVPGAAENGGRRV